MGALDVKKKNPILDKVREDLKRTDLQTTYKDKKRFQRLRSAIKKTKKNSGK